MMLGSRLELLKLKCPFELLERCVTLISSVLNGAKHRSETGHYLLGSSRAFYFQGLSMELCRFTLWMNRSRCNGKCYLTSRCRWGQREMVATISCNLRDPASKLFLLLITDIKMIKQYTLKWHMFISHLTFGLYTMYQLILFRDCSLYTLGNLQSQDEICTMPHYPDVSRSLSQRHRPPSVAVHNTQPN